MDNSSQQSVADFYNGKTIFITGVTGFIGQVLLEKLFYSCPDLDKIYILIREKEGLDIHKRLLDIFENPLFKRLKETYPNCLKKVVPINGDVEKPRLGMSLADEQTLIEKVSIVIHSAATVTFNEPLKTLWRINFEGTKMMLELARRMKRAEIFVYISTAYSNVGRQVIEEVLYPPPADIQQIDQLVKQELTIEDTKKIIGEHPNPYTFSKALTEHLVSENIMHIPTVIIRPSIVGATINEPIKGWLANWYGPVSTMMLANKGLIRVINGKLNNIFDLIPVDYVTNLVIVAAAACCRSRESIIYNSCSGSSSNPLLLGKLVSLLGEHAPPGTPFPRLQFITKRNWLISFVTILFQIIPAYIADIFRRIRGKRPKYVEIQSLVARISDAQRYFTGNSWIIKADHARNLFLSLSDSDKETFPCYPVSINWDEYLTEFLQGIDRLLAKKIKVKL